MFNLTVTQHIFDAFVKRFSGDEQKAENEMRRLLRVHSLPKIGINSESWFRSGSGTTNHSVAAYVDGESIGKLTGLYGGDRDALDSALKLLREKTNLYPQEDFLKAKYQFQTDMAAEPERFEIYQTSR